MSLKSLGLYVYACCMLAPLCRPVSQSPAHSRIFYKGAIPPPDPAVPTRTLQHKVRRHICQDIVHCRHAGLHCVVHYACCMVASCIV